jgi:transposase
MGRKVKQLKNYTTEQIETLFESDSNYLTGVNLFAIIQLTKGYSSRRLSEFYQTSFKQICNWANRFDAEGIKGLHMKPGRGRRSFLTKEQTGQLYCDTLKSPEEFGYDHNHWTCRVMQDHIKRKYRVEYRQAAVYRLMRQLRFIFDENKCN